MYLDRGGSATSTSLSEVSMPVSTRTGWQSDSLQDPSRVNQNFSLVCDGSASRQIVDRQIVLSRRLVPTSFLHPVLEADIFRHAVSLGSANEIIVKFHRIHINPGPIRVSLPRKGVGMRWNITRTTTLLISKHCSIAGESSSKIGSLPWIAVLKPRPTNRNIFFVDG